AIWLLRGRDGSFLVSCERGILASVSGSRLWLMPLTAEVPPRDRAVLLAGPGGPAPAPGCSGRRERDLRGGSGPGGGSGAPRHAGSTAEPGSTGVFLVMRRLLG